jgi:hypothetical protein
MKKFLLIAPLALIAACQQQASTPAAGSATVDPLTVTGALLVTAPDGSQSLNVIRDDGTYYETQGAMSTGKWAAQDGKICITPAAANAQANCFGFSTVGDDGTYMTTGGAGAGIKVKRIDQDDTAGSTPEHQVGAYLITETDGSQTIAVHSKNGTYHEAGFSGQGTSRVADGKRCFDPAGDAPETCSSAGDVYADGAFTYHDADGGTGLVQPLI